MFLFSVEIMFSFFAYNTLWLHFMFIKLTVQVPRWGQPLTNDKRPAPKVFFVWSFNCISDRSMFSHSSTSKWYYCQQKQHYSVHQSIIPQN